MRASLGTILVALCAAPLAVAPARAQNPVTNGLRAIEQRQAKNIVEAAEEMPADKYGFKPTPAQMSFGDVVAHLVREGNDYLCGSSSGQKAPDRGTVTGRRSISARRRSPGCRMRSSATVSISSAAASRLGRRPR